MKRFCILLSALLLLTGCAAAPAAASEPRTPPTAAETTAPPTYPTETTQPPETVEAVPVETPVTSVITGAQKTVTVSTVDEFLAALAPDTEIVLQAELLDLSTATGYGETGGEYYRWQEEFDGPSLYITNLTNLTIRSDVSDRTARTVSATPRYANVINFENCANVWLYGFTAGHTKEPGSCIGGVIGLWNCQDVLIEGCGLFGCGIYGVMAYSSKDIQIAKDEIYECSQGGLCLTDCKDVFVTDTTFRDLGGRTYSLYECENILEDGVEVDPFQ